MPRRPVQTTLRVSGPSARTVMTVSPTTMSSTAISPRMVRILVPAAKQGLWLPGGKGGQTTGGQGGGGQVPQPPVPNPFSTSPNKPDMPASVQRFAATNHPVVIAASPRIEQRNRATI
jgi:hypothetical protein